MEIFCGRGHRLDIWSDIVSLGECQEPFPRRRRIPIIFPVNSIIAQG